MKIKCKYNCPDNVPENVTSDFDYGLELHKEYIVMGIIINDKQISYFIDENGKPGFYPKEIFDITENILSDKWYFRPYSDDEENYSYVQVICGYYELVFDDNHYEKLVNRDEEALTLYFRRKIEIGKS